MPVIKKSDKSKSKSVGSSLDKSPTGSKYNLKFEKVSKTDEGGNTTKKLKCMTSNFKCLFYKRKTRESDGRSASESSKSSSPTGDSVNSSSSTPDGFQSPDLISKVGEIPVARERRKRTVSGDGSSGSGSGGTLDRPVPAPRTSRSSIIPSHSGRIPSHQVIYHEQSSLRNFHLQTLANFNPQSHLLFRPPTQNFRHPAERHMMSGSSAAGPPLPPRNNSNFPSVVYAPGRHGPMVAYVRGPFPPSRHPQHGSILRAPPVPHFPPPHVMQMRARQNQSQQAFILRYPPPPRLLFRSPYEQANYYHHQGEPYYTSNHRNHNHHHSSLPTLHETKYPLSGLEEDESVQNMHLPSIPPRNQSLSAQSYVSLTETQNEQLQQQQQQHHHNGRSLQRPLQILQEDSPPINNNRNMRKENSKVESSPNNASPVKNQKTDENHGDGDVIQDEINPSAADPTIHASPLWPTVLIDHKLPRVPNPMQDNNQRQIVTETMRQIGNRKASLNFTSVVKTNGSSTCSDLQRMEDSHKSSAPWFRGCASRIDGESSKDLRQRRNNNNSSLVNNNNNNGGGDATNVNCVRCSKVLPKPGGGLLLNQPVQCSICSLRVCKGCAVWNQSKNTLTCGHCHPPTSIDKTVNFWLDGVSHGESSFVTAERDKTTEDVREHLERLVESYIDEGVATVSLSRLFDNPQYDVLFHRFHQKLSDGLMNLGYSLKLAIENKPLSETPTSAHTTLTNLLVEVKEAAMELPLMETTTIPREKTKDEIISDVADGKKSSGEGQSSYEDVLATAILNKVVLNGQKARNKSDSPMSLVDSAVQTDSEMSETSEIVTQKNQYNVQGWVTNLEKRSPQQHSSNLSDDDLSMGTSSSNWSNEGPTHRGGTHQQIVIEEQVEEITTTYESDSDIGHSPPVRNRKLRKSGRHQRSNNSSEVPQTVVTNEDPLFGVDLSNFDKRVPFPEGGVDIISPAEAGVLHEDETQDPKGAALLVSQISEWEQNWLFKRRKQLFKKRNLMAEAVPMLVPNPNEEGIEPQIGAEKASDLSDLSDHVNEDDEDGDYIMSSSDEEKDNKAQDETVVDAPQAKNANGHQQVEVITTQINRPQEKKSSLVEQQINVGKAPVNNQSVKQEKVNPVTKVKVKPERKVERGMSFTSIPQDCKVSAGKTAKFVCTIGETSPSYSVAWFCEGALITSEKGKRWIYSAENTHRHYLYIYDVNEKDAGNYHVSVFDHRGNETKHTFKLAVSATEQRRTDPPTFTVLKEIVKASTKEHVLTIPFEITGFPEPYLEIYRNNVEISKLSHVLLEGEGAGKWVLQIRKNETDFSVDGEYVAVAKNKGGMTKVTFQIQHGEGVPIAIAETQKVTKDNLATAPENHAKSLSPQPRPVSAASQVSSIEETLRETSQSMDANQTLIKEDYEELLEWEQSRNIDSSKMTIAEREKLKWQNPVNLVNNPYAPENLAKRIRQRENSGFSLPPNKPGDISVTSSDDERPSVDRLAQNYQKFSRDYYVHGVQPSPSKLPTGPKFPPSMSLPLETARNKTPTSSKEPSVEKEEVPKEQPVSRKPSFLVNQPVVSESPVEIPKVPLEKRESIREKFEETGRNKKPVEMDKVPPLNKRQISSSPTPPPPEIRSSKSPTPSPDRSRQGSVESRSSKKDSVELEAIKLPSVKRLAQQFNKEPSPEETKVKEISKVPPPINHITRNLIKLQDSKSIQQVHSLTARSVSREFREGLRLSHPSPPNMNIKVAPKLSPNKENSQESKQEEQNESERETVTVTNNSKNSDNKNRQNGEETSNENQNNEMLTSAALNKSKRTASNSILSRAAFWDKRVKDGIVDDDVAIKEFPKVEGVVDKV